MEALAAIASVIQIAQLGAQISIALHEVAQTITSANRETRHIAKDIALFCAVLKDLARALEAGQEARQLRDSALDTSLKIAAECKAVFEEIRDVLKDATGSKDPLDAKFTLSRVEKIKWTFKKGKVEFFRSVLESLKSTMLVELAILNYRTQITSTTLREKTDEEELLAIASLVLANETATEDLEEIRLASSNVTDQLPGPLARYGVHSDELRATKPDKLPAASSLFITPSLVTSIEASSASQPDEEFLRTYRLWSREDRLQHALLKLPSARWEHERWEAHIGNSKHNTVGQVKHHIPGYLSEASLLPRLERALLDFGLPPETIQAAIHFVLDDASDFNQRTAIAHAYPANAVGIELLKKSQAVRISNLDATSNHLTVQRWLPDLFSDILWEHTRTTIKKSVETLIERNRHHVACPRGMGLGETKARMYSSLDFVSGLAARERDFRARRLRCASTNGVSTNDSKMQEELVTEHGRRLEMMQPVEDYPAARRTSRPRAKGDQASSQQALSQLLTSKHPMNQQALKSKMPPNSQENDHATSQKRKYATIYSDAPHTMSSRTPSPALGSIGIVNPLPGHLGPQADSSLRPASRSDARTPSIVNDSKNAPSESFPQQTYATEELSGSDTSIARRAKHRKISQKSSALLLPQSSPTNSLTQPTLLFSSLDNLSVGSDDWSRASEYGDSVEPEITTPSPKFYGSLGLGSFESFCDDSLHADVASVYTSGPIQEFVDPRTLMLSNVDDPTDANKDQATSSSHSKSANPSSVQSAPKPQAPDKPEKRILGGTLPNRSVIVHSEPLLMNSWTCGSAEPIVGLKISDTAKATVDGGVSSSMGSEQHVPKFERHEYETLDPAMRTVEHLLRKWTVMN